MGMPISYLLTWPTPAELGRRFGASVSVQGQAAIGLTQNAQASQPYPNSTLSLTLALSLTLTLTPNQASQPYLVGSAAMPNLFARTYATLGSNPRTSRLQAGLPLTRLAQTQTLTLT
eukprot:scaffold17325_cov53-Phaeocystis_antarctica.AAC.2